MHRPADLLIIELMKARDCRLRATLRSVKVHSGPEMSLISSPSSVELMTRRWPRFGRASPHVCCCVVVVVARCRCLMPPAYFLAHRLTTERCDSRAWKRKKNEKTRRIHTPNEHGRPQRAPVETRNSRHQTENRCGYFYLPLRAGHLHKRGCTAASACGAHSSR